MFGLGVVSGAANGISSAEPFKTATIEMKKAHSSLHIIHHDRHYSGGFSALWLSPDCSELITISDYSQVRPNQLDKPVRRSGWYQAKINYNGDKLASLTLSAQGQLKDIDGSVVAGAAESMEWDGEGFLVAFDDRGDIYRYKGKNPKGELFNVKPEIAYQQSNLGYGNTGLEAMTVLQSGDVLALWEKFDHKTVAEGRILAKSKPSRRFDYAAVRSPSGASTLADGSILILEKHWLGEGKGQHLRLVKLDPQQLSRPLKPVTGEVIMDEKSLSYDNNEGVSVCTRGGKQWVFVITDDNGDWPKNIVEHRGKTRQKTLLMQFDLKALN